MDQHNEICDLLRSQNELLRRQNELLEEQLAEMKEMHGLYLRGKLLGDDALVDRDELAQMMKVHPKTIYRMEKLGDLRPGAIGERKVYSIGAVREICRSMSKPTKRGS